MQMQESARSIIKIMHCYTPIPYAACAHLACARLGPRLESALCLGLVLLTSLLQQAPSAQGSRTIKISKAL